MEEGFGAVVFVGNETAVDDFGGTAVFCGWDWIAAVGGEVGWAEPRLMLIFEKSAAQINTSIMLIPIIHAQTGMARFLDAGAGGTGGM